MTPFILFFKNTFIIINWNTYYVLGNGESVASEQGKIGPWPRGAYSVFGDTDTKHINLINSINHLSYDICCERKERVLWGYTTGANLALGFSLKKWCLSWHLKAELTKQRVWEMVWGKGMKTHSRQSVGLRQVQGEVEIWALCYGHHWRPLNSSSEGWHD